jgi:FG-GAP repeat
VSEASLGQAVGANDYFGESVAISSGNLFIGAPGAFSGSGTVTALSGSGTNFSSLGAVTPNGGSESYGHGVAASGNSVITTGAPNGDGKEWLFTKTGSSWFYSTSFSPPSQASAYEVVSSEVAFDGTTLVAGGLYSVNAYAISGGPPQTLLPSDYTPANSSAFGLRVAIGGNTILALGEPLDGSGTSAHWGYVFVKSGSTWAQQARLIPSDLAATNNPHFQLSLAVDANTAVIATSNGSYIFTRSGATWTETQKLAAPVDENYYGSSVALSGNLLVVGAVNQNGHTGAVYVYGRSGNGRFKLSSTLASGAGSDFFGDYFGATVAASNGTVVVGAPNAYGQPGNVQNAGAVYLFSCAP